MFKNVPKRIDYRAQILVLGRIMNDFENKKRVNTNN
jgi:hypothetical protein